MKLIKCLALVAISAVLLVGCSKPEEARKVLKSQGYSDIKITGYKVFGCADGDTWSTGFIAKSVVGIETKGIVCRGLWLKASTIRLSV